MPTDIKYTEDKGIALDERGDYASLDGTDNIRQQIALTILNNVGDIDTRPLTPTDVDLYLTDVRSALQNSNVVTELVSIGLDTDETDDNTLVVTVKTTAETYGVSLQ
jgi:hypothetical protein